MVKKLSKEQCAQTAPNLPGRGETLLFGIINFIHFVLCLITIFLRGGTSFMYKSRDTNYHM